MTELTTSLIGFSNLVMVLMILMVHKENKALKKCLK